MQKGGCWEREAMGHNCVVGMRFCFVGVNMFWNQRWWLHVNTTELYPFKWLILYEFQLSSNKRGGVAGALRKKGEARGTGGAFPFQARRCVWHWVPLDSVEKALLFPFHRWEGRGSAGALSYSGPDRCGPRACLTLTCLWPLFSAPSRPPRAFCFMLFCFRFLAHVRNCAEPCGCTCGPRGAQPSIHLWDSCPLLSMYPGPLRSSWLWPPTHRDLLLVQAPHIPPREAEPHICD